MKINIIDEYAKVVKYIDGKTAVKQAFKSKGNIAMGIFTIGAETIYDVSQAEGTRNKVVVGATDVAFGAGEFALTTYATAKVSAAVGTAICPGVGTIIGVVVGFGTGYLIGKIGDRVKSSLIQK